MMNFAFKLMNLYSQEGLSTKHGVSLPAVAMV